MNATSEENQKLRRFALAVGVVLFTYAIAGVELKSPAEISPLGVPLRVRRPDLLGIALVIASVYAAGRFTLYGLILGSSPMSVRRALRRGKLGAAMEGGQGDYTTRFVAAVSRYFPGALRPDVPLISDGRGVVPKLTAKTRVLICAENIDYTAPVWVNVVSLVTYFTTSGGWWAVWSFVRWAV